MTGRPSRHRRHHDAARRRRTGATVSTAQVTTPGAGQAEERPAPPPEFTKVCVRCHPSDKIVEGRRYPAQWDQVLEQMVARGAIATDPELDVIYDYLVAQFGRVAINTAPADEIAQVLHLEQGAADTIVQYRREDRRVRRLRCAGQGARSAGRGAREAPRRDRRSRGGRGRAPQLSIRSWACSSAPPCRRGATRSRGARSAPPGARRGCARSGSSGCGRSRSSSAGAHRAVGVRPDADIRRRRERARRIGRVVLVEGQPAQSIFSVPSSPRNSSPPSSTRLT